MAVPRLGSLLLCRKFARQPTIVASKQSFSSSQSLLDVFYTKKHEWVNVEGSKGVVGVSGYAADSLGDIVYAQLPDVGSTVTAGEERKVMINIFTWNIFYQECGALESVKAVGDFFSPVSGTVTEKNEAVENGPAIINQSPMAEGWMFK